MSDIDMESRRQLTLAAKTMTPAQVLAFCQFLVESELETACHNPATREWAVECRAALNGLRVIKQMLEQEKNIMCILTDAELSAMSEKDIQDYMGQLRDQRNRAGTVLTQRIAAREAEELRQTGFAKFMYEERVLKPERRRQEAAAAAAAQQAEARKPQPTEEERTRKRLNDERQKLGDAQFRLVYGQQPKFAWYFEELAAA